MFAPTRSSLTRTDTNVLLTSPVVVQHLVAIVHNTMNLELQ
jgi:hypothetical protein